MPNTAPLLSNAAAVTGTAASARLGAATITTIITTTTPHRGASG